MPDITKVPKFVHSVNTGETDTTKALDDCFENVPAKRAKLKGNATAMGHLQTPHSLDDPTSATFPANVPPDWWHKFLRPPLKEQEIKHIDLWPDHKKEEVRQKLVEAIAGDRTLKFRWELWGGASEDTGIDDPDPAGGISITFRSPGQNVSASGLNLGSITVKVGPKVGP